MDKGNIMENSNTLALYISLFNSDCQQFKQYLAPNSVLDWFGRSVRGHTKIHDYLRNEVSSEYRHVDFENTQSCASIEYKPTHMETKQPPTGDVDYVLPRNKVSDIKTLKLYADSDLEDDDDDDITMTPLPIIELKTPEKNSQHVALNSSTTITPPTSTTKILPAAAISETDSDDDSDDNKPSTAKRLKRSHPSPFSYLRRQPTSIIRKIVNEAGIRSLLDTTSDDEEDCQQHLFDGTVNADHPVEEYTPLKYFETTGILRSQSFTKHNNVDETANISVAEAISSDPSAGSWDRPVRLRISYRQNTINQEIQFALIIYEHSNKSAMSSRRNLMLEFNQVADERSDGDEEDEEIGEIAKHQHERLLDAAITETTFLTSSEEPPAIPLMTTPTKLSNTPPATPKRKPRLPQSLSSVKRLSAHYPTATTLSPATPSPKRSAARSLRL